MSPAQALEFFKTKAEIARVLAVKPPSVAEWFDEGVIPAGRQYQLQLASDGKLIADEPANRKASAVDSSAH